MAMASPRPSTACVINIMTKLSAGPVYVYPRVLSARCSRGGAAAAFSGSGHGIELVRANCKLQQSTSTFNIRTRRCRKLSLIAGTGHMQSESAPYDQDVHGHTITESDDVSVDRWVPAPGPPGSSEFQLLSDMIAIDSRTGTGRPASDSEGAFGSGYSSSAPGTDSSSRADQDLALVDSSTETGHGTLSSSSSNSNSNSPNSNDRKFWDTSAYLPVTVADSSLDESAGPGATADRRGYVLAHLPGKWELDRLHGFFLGAYLSEGRAFLDTGTVRISYVDDEFEKGIVDFAQRHEIPTYFDDSEQRGTILLSAPLARLLFASIGPSAGEKRIPPELMGMEGIDEFFKGILDGFVSGEGAVHKSKLTLSCASSSSGLIDDISEICHRFGICCSKKVKEQLVGDGMVRAGSSTFSLAPSAYSLLSLNAIGTYQFANLLQLTSAEKQARLALRVQRSLIYASALLSPALSA